MSEAPNPYDELTALFVTGPEVERRRPVATVELAIVGSLPVRASLWLGPYADALARESGPAALVRLDGEAATIQLIGASPSPAADPPPTLVEAIAALGRQVGTWIVRPPLEADPATLAAAECDRISILCSVNDTAIVDAYQRVKAFTDAAREVGRHPLPLGVAVLGSDRHDAARMQQQLSRTAASYLGIEVPLVTCVERMDADIRYGECMTFDDGRPALSTVLMWIREATAAAAEPPAPAGAGSPQTQPAGGPGPSPVRMKPKCGIEVEPKEPELQQEPADHGEPVPMARYIDGVSYLPVRCPGHERLELAVDTAGRLHVAAPEANMRELHIVEAWARAHRELIARACPDHWFDPKARTVLHVFTARPTSVCDLQGSAVRLHVLARVAGEGEPRWYYAPLSE